MKKRVKMVDIARAADVSRTSVSLILNQVPGVRIAEATRQRVLQVARDLGYTPGPALSALDPDRKRVYGVLINEISSAYPVDLIYGMQNWADAQGIQLLIQVSDGVADHEMAALDLFERIGVAGVVYASTFSAIVSPAERHGGGLAAQHLIELGRKRIATIVGDPWQFASRERLAGYHRDLNKAGLNLGAQYEEVSDWGHASGYAAAMRLLSLPEPPDAIFCHNDIIARGALQAASEMGLNVPSDLAIVGYDDREFAKDMGISSITLPYLEMAEKALSELVDGKPLSDRVLSISGRLLQRASTVMSTQKQG
jgi:LacI family transcriptional regulator